MTHTPSRRLPLTWSCEPSMYLMHWVGAVKPGCRPMAVRSRGRSQPAAQSPPPWWPLRHGSWREGVRLGHRRDMI
jgi:hypothetical protein